MGIVYLARHTLLERSFALKILHPHLTADPRMVQRFLGEARAASRIVDPHVVHVSDFGCTEDRLYFLVMEHLVGSTLRAVLSGGPLAVPRVLHVLVQLAQAAASAHAAGVVHRDLKPENVFLVERRGDRSFVKVLDFGLAKLCDAPAITAAGEFFGSPGYMAPEQVSGRVCDHRVDLYSLGAIAYELLCGRPPFLGSISAVINAHLDCSAVPPRDLRPEIDPRISVLVMRCLEKDPGRRHESAAALLSALEAIEPEPEPPGRRGRGSQPALSPGDAADEFEHAPRTTSRVAVDAMARTLGIWEDAVDPSVGPVREYERVRRFRWRCVVDLVTLRWSGRPPAELKPTLSEVARREREIDERETRIALLDSQVEEILAEGRRAEAQLRGQLVDLEDARARLEEKMHALRTRDAGLMASWVPGAPTVAGDPQAAADAEVPRAIYQIDVDIRRVEERLRIAYDDSEARLAAAEASIQREREACARLSSELDLFVETLRQRCRPEELARPLDPALVELLDELAELERRLGLLAGMARAVKVSAPR